MLGSTITWPPSPPAWSNQRLLTIDLRWVPLSWVPPQYWPGTCGTVATLTYWPMTSLVLRRNAPVLGLMSPFRFSQSTAVRAGRGSPSRPPLLKDYQTPPSLPMTMWLVLSGSNAMAWKSGCRS